MSALICCESFICECMFSSRSLSPHPSSPPRQDVLTEIAFHIPASNADFAGGESAAKTFLEQVGGKIAANLTWGLPPGRLAIRWFFPQSLDPATHRSLDPATHRDRGGLCGRRGLRLQRRGRDEPQGKVRGRAPPQLPQPRGAGVEVGCGVRESEGIWHHLGPSW